MKNNFISIYKKFKYPPNKKYVKPNTKYQLLEEFESPFINFSNSLFKSNKYGEAAIDKNDKNGITYYFGIKSINWNHIMNIRSN